MDATHDEYSFLNLVKLLFDIKSCICLYLIHGENG
jgi:hypothetical protein